MIGPDIVEAGDNAVPKLSCNESVPRADRRFWGIFTRKERWGFSWYGWLLVACVLVLGTAGFVYTIFPFLAITQRVDSAGQWAAWVATRMTTTHWQASLPLV
jgi:hypothetical protein